MKVLMITPTYDPIIGGAEFVVKSLTNKLNELDIQTDILTFNMDKIWSPDWKNELLIKNNSKIYRVQAFNLFQRMSFNPTRFLFNVNIIPNLSFRKIFNEYDILHFHNDMDLTFPLFSMKTEQPKLLHCHSLDASFKYYNNRFWWKKLFSMSSDYFVGCCKHTLELLSELGISNDRIKQIHYSVDTDLYIPDYENKIDNLVLFVGRIEPRKGLHVLLESMNYIETPITLLIIPIDVGLKYGEIIDDMIKEQNTKGIHKIIIEKNIRAEELIPFYQKASIFVCSSLEDVFPTVNPQSLACGTPVVASDIGGISELIIDEKTGFLVPPGDPIKLGKTIKRLLIDKKLREKCGKQGRELVEKKYSLNSVVKQLIKFYEDISNE